MPAIKNNRIKQQIDRFKKSFLQSKELGVEVFFCRQHCQHYYQYTA